MEPVPEQTIRAIRPHLLLPVAAVIPLPHRCDARPQAVLAIRLCEVAARGEDWLVQPRSHKMTHLRR